MNSLNNNNNNIIVITIITYENFHTQKVNIYKDNKKKSSIYRWVHKETGKSYVGSASNLSQKLSNYFSILFFRRVLKTCSIIYNVILKYGYSVFKLEIIEYCDWSVLIEREQY